MNNFFRAIIAGYGAKKLGGGCFGTIIVFILIWVALGQCSFSPRAVPAPETFPADHIASDAKSFSPLSGPACVSGFLVYFNCSTPGAYNNPILQWETFAVHTLPSQGISSRYARGVNL